MRLTQRKGSRPGTALAVLGLGYYFEDDTPPPAEFRIFKYGENPSEKGTFVFDEASAATVMAEYTRHGKPMLLDFNHGTTLEAPTPEQAVSAGEFIPQIRGDEQGRPELWATDIKWTDRARAMVQAREYRLISPFFEHDAKTLRVLRLINVALTNLPALDGIAPLMAASLTATEPERSEHMDEIEKLKAQVAELTAKLSAKDEELSALSAKLSAFEEKDKTATSALSALKATHDKVAELEGKLTALTTEKLSLNFQSTLDKAVTEGKVTPAQRSVWESQAKAQGYESTLSLLSAIVASAAPVAAAQAHTSPAAGLAIPDAQKTVLKNMGIPADKFAEFEAKRLAGL